MADLQKAEDDKMRLTADIADMQANSKQVIYIYSNSIHLDRIYMKYLIYICDLFGAPVFLEDNYMNTHLLPRQSLMFIFSGYLINKE